MSKKRNIENASRRRFVQGAGAALAAGPAVLWSSSALAGGRGAAPLFTLGVASGDPTQSVVLWTRLAPDPLNGGGMGRRPVPVRWEVARDPHFKRPIRKGVTIAHPRNGHAVNVVARGLPSDCWLYYRFEAGGQYSRVGRTRTFPAPWDYASQVRFAVVSCQDYEAGYYTAYRDMASQNIDFVVHTGDYIYEYGPAANPVIPGRVNNSPEIFSVDDYRNRYALYRLDPDLQEVHALFPFIVTWDDHEVENNYAGLTPEENATYTGADFVQRRQNAYRVYSETMPLRPRNRLRGRSGQMELYRKLAFGDLADIHVLDTRQYRTNQPAEDGFGSTQTLGPVEPILEAVFAEKLFDPAGIDDPSASMLGWRQEYWLARNLYRSRARWNVLAQQIMQMEWNLAATARAIGAAGIQADPNIPAADKPALLATLGSLNEVLNVDAWDGYRAARERLFHVLDALRPNNPVVLTGDIHSSWAANLLKDFSNPNSDMLAAEFVCTSISSTFAGIDPRPTDGAVRLGLPDNPHIEFFNGLFRGYMLCDVDRHRWQTEYRAVGTLADAANPSPLALVPQQSSTVETDAIVEIEAGFNREGGSDERLQTTFARLPISS